MVATKLTIHRGVLMVKILLLAVIYCTRVLLEGMMTVT